MDSAPRVPLGVAMQAAPSLMRTRTGLGGDDVSLVWRLAGVALLGIVALGCLHGLLYHLHAILVPFVLSGFIVLALQPAVEATYRLLAGRRAPYRWCICGCVRRQPLDDSDSPGNSDVEKAAPTAPIVYLEQPPASSRAPPSSRASASSRAAESSRAASSARRSKRSSTETQPLLEMTTDAFWSKALDSVMRLLAVVFIISLLILSICCVCVILVKGATHMKDDWSAYQTGYYRLGSRLDRMLEAVSKELKISQGSDAQVKEVYSTILNKAQDYVLDMVNAIVTGLSGGLSDGCIMMLYVLFWLLEPLPTGGKFAGTLVRSYLYKKSLVSFLYGLCVALLFLILGIDLAMLFGMVAFFLNFLPEVGAIICTLIPAPVILLDGRIENPFQVLIASIVGQLFLKFIFSNILEVKLIERDKEMSIHPVWVILGLCYFGFVWGPVGMLISVPMLAMLKTAAMSVKEVLVENEYDEEGNPSRSPQVANIANTFLSCFEGRSHRKNRDSVDDT